jgi:hypothetical protein
MKHRQQPLYVGDGHDGACSTVAGHCMVALKVQHLQDSVQKAQVGRLKEGPGACTTAGHWTTLQCMLHSNKSGNPIQEPT